MSMTFRVWQQVECIDASPGRMTGCDDLRKGAIYTVVRTGHITSRGEPAIWVNIPTGSWRASRFRPVVSRKTDISIFTAMLSPSQVTVDAMNIADCGREIVR